MRSGMMVAWLVEFKNIREICFMHTDKIVMGSPVLVSVSAFSAKSIIPKTFH